MIVVVAVVVIGCALLALLISRGRHGRQERDPELDEALERMRDTLRRRSVVIGAAAIVALLLIAGLARNPSRWPLLLLALAVLGVGVVAFVVTRGRAR